MAVESQLANYDLHAELLLWATAGQASLTEAHWCVIAHYLTAILLRSGGPWRFSCNRLSRAWRSATGFPGTSIGTTGTSPFFAIRLPPGRTNCEKTRCLRSPPLPDPCSNIIIHNGPAHAFIKAAAICIHLRTPRAAICCRWAQRSLLPRIPTSLAALSLPLSLSLSLSLSLHSVAQGDQGDVRTLRSAHGAIADSMNDW